MPIASEDAEHRRSGRDLVAVPIAIHLPRLPAAGRERAPLPNSKLERDIIGRFGRDQKPTRSTR